MLIYLQLTVITHNLLADFYQSVSAFSYPGLGSIVPLSAYNSCPFEIRFGSNGCLTLKASVCIHNPHDCEKHHKIRRIEHKYCLTYDNRLPISTCGSLTLITHICAIFADFIDNRNGIQAK
jgi:hypothetical protein